MAPTPDTQGALADIRDKTESVARDAAHSLEGNPLALVASGLAIGAIAGVLIPRSSKEKELLAPVGRTLAERARSAVGAAREAGYQALDERGLTKDAARDQVKSLFQGLSEAVQTAGSAAARSAKTKA
ncbi:MULTISPECIES: hypothetical protein [unclassified Sphingomonas]|jgi:hypothetical protein|uniref:hypothetical protein n=1 Tax=unclassified Sphingomonas TaxID=196159 RepID=UPI000E1088AA|nr:MULTISPECIES: hypothetical protein [unclassified Sphingomonas]AXJ94201.1 hypothetical protein DM480_00540 [Sphingomonas sp. FARSPH]